MLTIKDDSVVLTYIVFFILIIGQNLFQSANSSDTPALKSGKKYM